MTSQLHMKERNHPVSVGKPILITFISLALLLSLTPAAQAQAKDFIIRNQTTSACEESARSPQEAEGHHDIKQRSDEND